MQIYQIALCQKKNAKKWFYFCCAFFLLFLTNHTYVCHVQQCYLLIPNTKSSSLGSRQRGWMDFGEGNSFLNILLAKGVRINALMFLMFSDSKITQWEDPRLQNPAITGPVSIFMFLLFIRACGCV